MEPMDKLDPERIEERLEAGRFFHTFHVLDEVTSTNEVLASWATEKNIGEGTLLAAERQTAGKGRMGRSWVSSPHQSLTFSFLCPNYFPESPGFITVGVALACTVGIEKETGLSPDIKWPNDLYLGTRKVAGVLAQTVSSPGPALMVVGVGINVNAPPPSGAAPFAAPPTCLREAAGRAIDRSLLLASLLEEIGETALRLARGDARFVAEGLRQRSLLIGARAKFEWKKRCYEGRVTDHTDDLAIRLETPEGIVTLPGETAHLVSFRRS